MSRRRKRKITKKIGIFKLKLSPFTYFVLVLFGIYLDLIYKDEIDHFLTGMNYTGTMIVEKSYNLGEIPEYSGSPYVIINNNVPFFNEEDITTNSYEKYSNHDVLGRCGVAIANIGIEMMPTEPRGSIGMIKPSGWHTVKYNNVDGKYLYNRCHLIGYQLTGQNDNEKNLITCTRYMNTVGMLKFENMVADYIKRTDNHVLYRVTPIYNGNNLLANGVEMEAYSVEDHGSGIKFNVYVYNVQDGIVINYKNGNSYLDK